MAPFVGENLSVTEISEKTGLKRTAVWKNLKAFKDETRKVQSVPYDRWRKGHKRTGARPPYGFCFLLGEVVPEPKEYSTLIVIHRLWNSGSSTMSILSQLQERGAKSRTGREWSYGVIRTIIERFESEAIVQKSGKLVLSEQFLKGISLPTKASQKPKRG